MPKGLTFILFEICLLFALIKHTLAAECGSGTDDKGKRCPPDDANGPCPPGCEAAVNFEAITCKTYPTTNGFGVEFPCGYENGLYSSSEELQYPMSLTSGNSGSLDIDITVEAYTLDAIMFNLNARAYCYNGICGPVGPTLRVKPGDTLTVRLINNLESEGIIQDGKHVNEFRHSNYTNIHTHGLHIDPAVDNVLLHAKPGDSLIYEYTIPEDHMIGTHWYHSHVHGASAMQVMGGLLGAIVVEPTASLDLPAAYTAMEEHLLVFSHVSLCTCNPTNDPFRIVDYQELYSKIGDTLPLDAQVGSDGISDVYLTNGQYQPTLSIAPGEWVRLEMLNAVGDTFLEVELRDGLIFGEKGIASGCQMKLLSLDGVFLNSGVRTPYDDVVLLNPASRASIAIMCSTSGTRYLQTNPMNRACDYESAFFQNLLYIEVSGTEVTMEEPAWTVNDIARPYYLMDLRDTPPTNGDDSTSVWEVGVEQTDVVGGAFWLGVGDNCEIVCTNRGCEAVDPNSYGSCPYVAFGYPESTEPRTLANFPYRHVGKVCDVEDMVIHGRGRTPHPMHIHVNHFQIVEFVGNENSYAYWGEIGDWRDTVGAFQGKTRVRYVLDEYGGNIVLHCHFLYHEDQGMMDRIWVDSDESLRCTASSSGSAETHNYCDISGSELASIALDDDYPSVISSCRRSNVPTEPDPTTNTPVLTPLAIQEQSQFPFQTPTRTPSHTPTRLPTRTPTQTPTIPPNHVKVSLNIQADEIDWSFQQGGTIVDSGNGEYVLPDDSLQWLETKLAPFIENSTNDEDPTNSEVISERSETKTLDIKPVGRDEINIFLNNTCSETISVALRYEDNLGDWQSLCWYNVNSGESYFPTNSGEMLSTENGAIYIYAESTNWVWSTGNTLHPNVNRSCKGRNFSMFAWNYFDTNGNLNIYFTCDASRDNVLKAGRGGVNGVEFSINMNHNEREFNDESGSETFNTEGMSEDYLEVVNDYTDKNPPNNDGFTHEINAKAFSGRSVDKDGNE